MSSYKDYMDRIRVDGEQHDRLMEAVRAAEAAQTGEKKETSAEPRVRRFPLKSLALIASAAAVIVIAVGIMPGSRKPASSPANFLSSAAPDTVAPGNAQVTANEGASNFNSYSQIAEQAELTAAPSNRDTKAAETASKAPEDPAPAEAASSERAVFEISIKKHEAAAAEHPVEQPAEPQTPQAESAAESDYEEVQPAGKTEEDTAAWDDAEVSETAFMSLDDMLISLKSRIENHELETVAEAATSAKDADYDIRLDEFEFSYSCSEGIIRTEDAEYVLSEAEQKELNELLDEHLADK